MTERPSIHMDGLFFHVQSVPAPVCVCVCALSSPRVANFFPLPLHAPSRKSAKRQIGSSLLVLPPTKHHLVNVTLLKEKQQRRRLSGELKKIELSSQYSNVTFLDSYLPIILNRKYVTKSKWPALIVYNLTLWNFLSLFFLLLPFIFRMIFHKNL